VVLKVKTYIKDTVIEEFYAAAARNDNNFALSVHIPLSDVFYVREALFHALGKRYTLDYVEWAMLKEGMLSVDDCFEGSIRVKWNEYQGEKLCKTRN